jgi:hypothetical protein
MLSWAQSRFKTGKNPGSRRPGRDDHRQRRPRKSEKPDGGILRKKWGLFYEVHFSAALVVSVTPPGADTTLKMPPSHFPNLK